MLVENSAENINAETVFTLWFLDVCDMKKGHLNVITISKTQSRDTLVGH